LTVATEPVVRKVNMKRTVLFFLLIASAANSFLTASVANAISYEGYKSKVEGVGLWKLFNMSYLYNKGSDAACVLRFDEHPELAGFCDGKNKLYIYEKGQQGFICETVDRKETLKNVELAKKKKDNEEGQSVSYQKEYVVLLKGLNLDLTGGIYTVSNKRLGQGEWTVAAPTKDEKKSSAKIASDNQKKIHSEISATSADYKPESLIGYSDKRLREIKNEERIPENKEGYTLKITTHSIDIIIIPTLYVRDDGCCDIISTVVLKKNNAYTYLGHISGWLRSVGADIDSDGVPEVITQHCGCLESCDSIQYIKIYPVIKDLITWSCS
jgi:hypothetical protein